MVEIPAIESSPKPEEPEQAHEVTEVEEPAQGKPKRARKPRTKKKIEPVTTETEPVVEAEIPAAPKNRAEP